MKLLFTLLLLNFGQTVFAQTETYVLKEKYKNKKGKEIISFNKSGKKDGVSKYYNQKGNLDSTVTYNNGKLNGLKTFFYTDDEIFYSDYVDDSLIRQRLLSKSNELKYQSPFDISKTPETTYKFSSGRSYFDLTKTDTLILNTNVPELNLNIYFPGATVFKIDYHTYEIRNWKPQPNSSKGKIVIEIIDDVFNDTKLLREETLYPTLQ